MRHAISTTHASELTYLSVRIHQPARKSSSFPFLGVPHRRFGFLHSPEGMLSDVLHGIGRHSRTISTFSRRAVHSLSAVPTAWRRILPLFQSPDYRVRSVDAANRSVSIGHLGVIAISLERKVQWDPERERFINDRGANHMLSRPMRGEWQKVFAEAMA